MSITRPQGDWRISRPPVHPGEMLREEFMKPLGISINSLALELHVPVTRISQIVNERRGITADTALRLPRHFGTSADFWMNIQKDYELVLTRHKSLRNDRPTVDLYYLARRSLSSLSARNTFSSD